MPLQNLPPLNNLNGQPTQQNMQDSGNPLSTEYDDQGNAYNTPIDVGGSSDSQDAGAGSGSGGTGLGSMFSGAMSSAKLAADMALNAIAEASSGYFGIGIPEGEVAAGQYAGDSIQQAGQNVQSGLGAAGTTVGNSITQATQNANSNLNTLATSSGSAAGNYFVRFILICAALVLIVIALNRLTGASDKIQTIAKHIPPV